MARIRFKGFENVMVNRVCDYLVEQGKRVIRNALALRAKGHPTYAENDTGTQMDAFGLIVYYKGRSQRSLFGADSSWTNDLTHSLSADWGSNTKHHGLGDIPDATGYEWAQMFAKEFSKKYKLPKDGFALVVYNAAFYSGVLERGGGGIRHKYKVLSQVSGDMRELQSKLAKSKLVGYNINI